MAAQGAQQPSVQEVLTELFNSVPHRFQLEDWRIEEKTLRDRIHRKEKNFSAVESEIFELMGLFTLFQGVIFSAVAQTSILKCRDWWSPFCMSIIVSGATLFALVQRLRNFAYLKKELDKACLQAHCLYETVQDLQGRGVEFDLNRLGNEPREPPEQTQVDVNTLSKICFEYILTQHFAVVATVIVFSVIMLVSCRRLLCSECRCAN